MSSESQLAIESEYWRDFSAWIRAFPKRSRRSTALRISPPAPCNKCTTLSGFQQLALLSLPDTRWVSGASLAGGLAQGLPQGFSQCVCQAAVPEHNTGLQDMLPSTLVGLLTVDFVSHREPLPRAASIGASDRDGETERETRREVEAAGSFQPNPRSDIHHFCHILLVTQTTWHSMRGDYSGCGDQEAGSRALHWGLAAPGRQQHSGWTGPGGRHSEGYLPKCRHPAGQRPGLNAVK